MSPTPELSVCLSPLLLKEYVLPDSAVVVIDILRATSSIVTALANHAREVIPTISVEACEQAGKSVPQAITAGERDGKIIPGLMMGNSPLEYQETDLQGKTLIITTTNGTQLISLAEQFNASEILMGSFLNISATARHLIKGNKNTILACAAWKGKPNIEDTLFAGALAHQLQHHFTINCDSALLAMALYESKANQLETYIQKGTHYQRLHKMQLAKDVAFCLSQDKYHWVALYHNKCIRKQ